MKPRRRGENHAIPRTSSCHHCRRLKLEFHGSKITSDGGFLAYRELDDALGLTSVAGKVFHDSRSGMNGWHGMTGQFRQSLFGRLGGYEDVNNADRLARDPAMRWIVGGNLSKDEPHQEARWGVLKWNYECPSSGALLPSTDWG